jgi:hypothetical protein
VFSYLTDATAPAGGQRLFVPLNPHRKLEREAYFIPLG